MKYEDYAKVRDAYGLSDAKVAKEANIGQSTFSDWKSGRSVPKEAKIAKIARVLGITTYELRTGEAPDSLDKLHHIMLQDNEEDLLDELRKHLSEEEQQKIVDMAKLLFPDKF